MDDTTQPLADELDAPEASLPEFELDCRDWFVSRPDDAELDDDAAPVLAVLSTVVLDDQLREATGSITVGLLDDGDDLSDLEARPVRAGCPAREVLDIEPEPNTRRYVVPAPSAPDQPRLALLAEFTVPADAGAELDRRVDELMGSFRWHAA